MNHEIGLKGLEKWCLVLLNNYTSHNFTLQQMIIVVYDGKIIAFEIQCIIINFSVFWCSINIHHPKRYLTLIGDRFVENCPNCRFFSGHCSIFLNDLAQNLVNRFILFYFFKNGKTNHFFIIKRKKFPQKNTDVDIFFTILFN
jgi:hypothetical protein